MVKDPKTIESVAVVHQADLWFERLPVTPCPDCGSQRTWEEKVNIVGPDGVERPSNGMIFCPKCKEYRSFMLEFLAPTVSHE